MKRYAVVWTQTAIEDLDSILDHVSFENSENALRILRKIKDRCALLHGNPSQGRIVPELNCHGIVTYREIIISPWRVLYRIANTCVYVLAVIDGRRNLEDILLSRIIRGGHHV